MSPAIDASAVIAFLRGEPGADLAARHLRRSCLSAVNLSEVLEKAPDREGSVARILAMLKNWQVEIVPFDVRQAAVAAEIKHRVGRANVSMADRACLALALSRGIPAVTADRLSVRTERHSSQEGTTDRNAFEFQDGATGSRCPDSREGR